MENLDIARLLREVADLLEIQGANPFRIRAYRNAIHTVEDQTKPLRKRVAEGEDLTELPGIGKEMASHIWELVETGSLSLHQRLLEEIPRGLLDLIHLPNVGPKRAKLLHQELGVRSVDELEAAAQAGRVAGIKGFGAKSQEKILHGIEEFRHHQERCRLGDADLYVGPLLEHLRQAPGLERLEVAGSYRRRRETVGDLDLLAVAEEPGPVAARFLAYPQVAEVVMSGDTRSSVVLTSGLQVDLRIVPAESYGAALVYFTGSKEHNVKLRQRGVERGLKISEYGVFEVADEGAEGRRLAGEDEEGVYAAVDLLWIPPELREDRGEIEAAARGALPQLLRLEDLRGDLQMHSTWSDGKSSVEEMLEACVARGYEYFALTDHSKALAMTGGLDAEKVRRQWREIDEVASRHPEIRFLKSLEVDILADGSLDMEDEILEGLDVVVVSVHSRFDLPARQQTQRILKALEHPRVHILAHPTGRLINRRKPYDFDLEEVLLCARDHGVALELNAHPERLDLKDSHLMEARRRGVKVVISTDAHLARDLDLMRYGVEQARRAWLGPADVLNTLPVDALLASLRSPASRTEGAPGEP